MLLNLKKIMFKKLQKAVGENKGLTTDINDMRAVINTSAPSLGEEGTKTNKDLKRQMVLLEEENIKLFMKIYSSKKNPKKYFLSNK